MDKYYKNIKQLIENNLIEAKKYEISANYHTLITYHNIGKEIVEAQGGKRAGYGDGLIKEYALNLSSLYGKNYNFSTLKRMRQFYLLFPKGAAMRHQLNWTILKVLLPIKDESKRNCYINSITIF